MRDRLIYRYRWRYPEPEFGGYLARCIDLKTGGCVCQYDLGDPADWNPEYGGESQSDMLRNQGLDPSETIPLSEALKSEHL